MAASNEEIHALLMSAFPGATVEVKGDGYYYTATVFSDVFNGMTKLQRHKKVYSVLTESIRSGSLHALTINALTHAEQKDR